MWQVMRGVFLLRMLMMRHSHSSTFWRCAKGESSKVRVNTPARVWKVPGCPGGVLLELLLLRGSGPGWLQGQDESGIGPPLGRNRVLARKIIDRNRRRKTSEKS